MRGGMDRGVVIVNLVIIEVYFVDIIILYWLN